ncbi:YagK/YfjJ domain-containing protein [Acinetobacter bereziniae]|uniref:YagK/YfjJ domain-containing protein n=1 Tax=Acinetobacter bereziniae TaxID=106648 RepID=UPI00124FC37A|nr:inovirus-type Gp2 protein [Acinetobacter bereziniae]
MSESVNESKVLIEIECFVEDIVSKKTEPKNFYKDLTDLLIQFNQIYSPPFYYSASIGAFIELINDFDEYLELGFYSLLLNKLKQTSFDKIQRSFKRHYRRHERQLRDHRYAESQNSKQLITRMKKVSDDYSRILVVRVDLAYPLKHQVKVGIKEFSHHMEILRKRINDQDKIFKGLIESAWALEQGTDKGYHCHLLLVYKGSEHCKAYGIAKQVGDLWKSITGDLGCYFNCHDSNYLKQFSDRNTLGIGMIHRKNKDEVNNMLNTVKYLVRPEKENQHLRVKCKKHMRTFA